MELEGETDEVQIDEAWVWFSGGFGEVRIGPDDEALANACVMLPVAFATRPLVRLPRRESLSRVRRLAPI